MELHDPSTLYLQFFAPAQRDGEGYLWVSLNKLANKVCDGAVVAG
jgi:hypothetical protein